MRSVFGSWSAEAEALVWGDPWFVVCEHYPDLIKGELIPRFFERWPVGLKRPF